MERALTVESLECFLNDHYSNSKTVILEEGKEKEDLYKIAEAKGIKVKGSKDLAVFKNVYAFPDIANKNGARLPKKELLRALPGIVGKPVNLEHSRKYVVGFYIDYSFKQKTNEVITYGILFKSNFPEEFADIKAAFKEGKLNTSYEIWCPRDKRKLLSDGTYALEEQEIAGGAILIKSEPAFDGAKVLDVAKKSNLQDVNLDGWNLEYSSKHLDDELIKADSTVPVAPIVPAPIAKINIVDFHVNCPDCKMSNWNVIKETEEEADVQCTACNGNYTLKFSNLKISDDFKKLSFFYEGRVTCYQCGKNIHFSQFAKADEKIDRNIKCQSCGLVFPLSVCKKDIKQVISIVKANKTDIDSVKKEGEDIMAKSKKTEPIIEPIVDPKVDTVVEPEIASEPIVEPAVITEPVVEPIVTPVVAEPIVASEPVIVSEPVIEPIAEPIVPQEVAKVEKATYVSILKKAATKIRKFKKECLTIAASEAKTKDAFMTLVERAKASKGVVEGYETELATVKEALQKEINKVKADSEQVKAFYMENATKINQRRTELADFAKDLSDEQILDDKDFEIAKLNKENEIILKSNLNTSSVSVGDKDRNKDNGLDEFYTSFRDKVDKTIEFNKYHKSQK